MTGVARAGKHGIIAADLAREHHAIAVVGKESVFLLIVGLKILGGGHADGGAVEAIAPGDDVILADLAAARIVSIHKIFELFVFLHQVEGLGIDVPMNAVLRERGVDAHFAAAVVHAEHARKLALIGHHGAVKDGVRAGNRVARNDGIQARAPHDFAASGRPVFPGNILKSGAEYLSHRFTLLNSIAPLL